MLVAADFDWFLDVHLDDLLLDVTCPAFSDQ